ncbi:MAG: ABC transporter ATP-binding protein [Clostridia bacterium]|nr:ABC transporter ATP-binding protein [Clostridia bacterium]
MLFGKHINKYYLKHLPVLILGLLALIVVDYFQLLIPELYSIVINGVNDGYVVIDKVTHIFDMNLLLDKVCLPLIFVIVFMVIGRFLWRVCFFGTAIKVETDLRGKMFDRCKDLSQNYYHKNKVGNLMSLFTNDLETIHECLGMGILSFLDASVLGVWSLIKMFQMNKMLTLLSLIPMSLMLIIGTIVRKYMMKKWETRQEAFSRLSDYSQESYSGIAVIKAFVKEAKELLVFRWLNKKNEDANVDHTKASTLLNVFVTLFVESVICVILGYGGYLVHENVFNAGEFIEFIGYFNLIIWPITAISQLIEMQSRGKASLNRIGRLLDTEIEIKDSESTEDVCEIKGDIEFKNLTFRYEGSEYDALKNVSFKINQGENVGIVGKTGSGKTTVVDLILRTYNVDNDTILIDGIDINKIPIKQLRQNCAYVPQDNFLFSDTIANNIAFASDSDDVFTVEESARLADIHSNIIEFSRGYETVLGERGVTVSGGQKQRISIARALMKNAPILILDDSVSAVDTKTEKIILENLKSVRKNKTTILIAHRISTVENMDKIIFIDDGKISAIGTHSELYNSSKDYKTMVELQRLEEKKEGDE